MLSASTAFAWEIMDGETWRQLEQEEKENYIKGFIEGFNIMFVVMMSEAQPGVDMDLVAMQLEREEEFIELEKGDLDQAVSNIDEAFRNGPDKTLFDLMVEDQLNIGP